MCVCVLNICVCVCVCVCVYFQGVSGGILNILGGGSMYGLLHRPDAELPS
jgi:hypothetical protein